MSGVAWRQVRARGSRAECCHRCPRSAPGLPACPWPAGPSLLGFKSVLSLSSLPLVCLVSFFLLSVFFCFIVLLFFLLVLLTNCNFSYSFQIQTSIARYFPQAQPAERLLQGCGGLGALAGTPWPCGLAELWVASLCPPKIPFSQCPSLSGLGDAAGAKSISHLQCVPGSKPNQLLLAGSSAAFGAHPSRRCLSCPTGVV